MSRITIGEDSKVCLECLFGVDGETARRALSRARSARHAEWVLLHAHVERLDVEQAAAALGPWRDSVAGHLWALGWRSSRWAPDRGRLPVARAVVGLLRAVYGCRGLGVGARERWSDVARGLSRGR